MWLMVGINTVLSFVTLPLRWNVFALLPRSGAFSGDGRESGGH